MAITSASLFRQSSVRVPVDRLCLHGQVTSHPWDSVFTCEMGTTYMPLTGEVQGLSAILCVDCLYMASPPYATACSGSLLLILALVSCLLAVIETIT